ncbi:CobW family GTP-binding protein [Desmospora profundinema]|uniref:G3E family GTPase n=1 Tax=Desmospora profundinema TaxID=1571184 RepID=A0ABU1ITN1_9BACL|nr:GTP-binding protein [Desmospora profundinema]MDR6227279.1 G3E family GTPase [Desmospora profundinema]
MKKHGNEPIPVTVLTGFLGAGKTTLLNHVLTGDHGETIAVIVNEFGEVGIDNELLQGSEEEIVEMNNGCICCQVRGDLIRILNQLIESNHYFDRVIIETTGLANPGPVAQTFFVDEGIAEAFMLDAVVTVVDAVHADQHLDEQDETMEQVAFADVVLLNKIDLVKHEELDRLKRRLRSINPMARFHQTVYSRIDLKELLGIKAFDIKKKLELDPKFLEGHGHHHKHDDDVKAFVLRENRPLDLKKIQLLFSIWIQVYGQRMFRYKGFLDVQGMEERVVFQGVHMLFGTTVDRKWKLGEKRQSEIVIIGKDLNSADFQQQFSKCSIQDETA